MLNVYIDNVLIPDSDIVGISDLAAEKLQFNFTNLIASTISIDLKNIDQSKYDDEVAGSLLEDGFYNVNLKIIDTVTALTIWDGRIKNIRKDDNKGIITIESANYIKEIVDAVCVINLGGGSVDVTPSEIIYTIITDVCGIPETAINKTSFDIVKAVQIANQGYIITKYTADANINCSAVIGEILRITSSYLYTSNNIIYYSQYSPYDGDQGTHVDESRIIAGTYSSEYSTENIYNDYSIAYYSSSSAVAYAVPTTTPEYITSSQTKYGTKTFLVPDDEVDDTLPSAYKILVKTLTSARYYGEIVRSSSHYAKNIVSLTIRETVEDITLNSAIDVTYKHLSREPMRVIERKIDPKKHTVTLKAEMVNFPYVVIDRDKTPPDAVELINVKYGVGNSAILYWTVSADTSFKQYLLEFTTSPADYVNETANEGYSPIKIESPVVVDGLCTYTLTGLEENSVYYFRVRVSDNASNISEPSNVMTLEFASTVIPVFTAEYYHCSGDLEDGLVFEDGVGTVPSGYVTYDDINYDTGHYGYAGIHTSTYYARVSGFNEVILKSNQPSQYYKVQARSYVDGVNGTWIDAETFISEGEYKYKIEFENSPAVVQFRVFFAPLNYSNSYNVIIDTIN